MARFRIHRSFFSYFSLMILAGWPAVLFLDNPPSVRSAAIAAGNLILLVVVYLRSTSPYMSFLDGLHAVSIKYSSGCGNLTMLYMPVVHGVLYLIMVVSTFIGFFAGKRYTEETWQNMIYKIAEETLYL